jgi:hypothetical protein
MDTARPLIYVDSDIPAGLTIHDWRHARRPDSTTATPRLRRLARRVGF